MLLLSAYYMLLLISCAIIILYYLYLKPLATRVLAFVYLRGSVFWFEDCELILCYDDYI